MTEYFFQKGGGSDQPSADHKLVLYFLASFNKINLPKYLMHHLCWAVKEGMRGKRKQIPCGRLLSEIVTQGKLLETLRRNNLASDKILRTRTGKIINGKTLQNMKIIKKFSPNEKDLKEFAVQTALMTDFPPIYKERNPEVLAELIAGFVKESGGIILDNDTPDVPDEAPLQVRGKRTQTDAGSEATGAQTKKSKKDKSEASIPDSSSSPAPKRKRGKGESSLTKDVEAEEARAAKKQSTDTQNECPMFIVTPAMARMAKEYADTMIADKKQKKLDYLAERTTKLKSLGLENCDEYYMQKIAEVRQIAGSVEQQAVEEAKEMLELIPEASEVGASEAAPESATIVEALEASASLIQTSDLPSTIPTPLSHSNDSDHDEIPLGQRMKNLPKPSSKPSESNYTTILKSIGEMSERRVEICNQLPADHPFQPPTIEPLNMILPNKPQPSQPTKQTPLQEEQTSAAAEGYEDPEEPKTSDLPKCDSPSNLFYLERHLGGELQDTPEKATTSVPEQTDVVNQQQPEPIQQTTPEPSSTPLQTTTQTQTSLPTQTSTKLQIIPEVVVESVAEESVQVTKSETTISITDPSLTNNQPVTTNDQPSSSSSQSIQTLKQPPPNLLKSEVLEAELLQISNEMQRLVKLRRTPTLQVAYQEQWATLKKRASELMDLVSQ